MPRAALLPRLFGLTSQAAWRRHANPWSVWTRFAILPLLALAVWARVWIGAWCLLPVAALIVWTVLNPVAFPPVAPNRGWAWRAVMGERLWTLRREPGAAPIPLRHLRWAGALAWSAAPPALLAAWGLWRLDALAVIGGVLGVIVMKMWFLDRMVRLHDAIPPGPEPAPRRAL